MAKKKLLRDGTTIITCRKTTIVRINKMAARGEKIAFVTAYDYPTACIAAEAGIDMILVGDSGSMTKLGTETTIPATMDQMINMSLAVTRGVRDSDCKWEPWVVGDMPYMSYQTSMEDAVRNAMRFQKEADCDAIKLEGGARVAKQVRAIVDAGVPVMGHLGLTPQNMAQFGGYRVQGKNAAAAKQIIEDALALQDAGCCSILLECVPDVVGRKVKEKLDIPVFGIGGGAGVDGQLVISDDILGIFRAFYPKFVTRYANIGDEMFKGFKQYVDEVKSGEFPQPHHFYQISKDEDEQKRVEEEIMKL